MKIIKPYVKQMTPPIDGVEFLKAIERAGRVCYKSEDKITDESCVEFVRRIIKNEHHAMLEHAPSISMKFVCDRGVSHEIVRHRLFSYAQESTRYCNYGGKDIVFILPCWFGEKVKAVLTDEKYQKYLNIDDEETIWKLTGINTTFPEGQWIDAMLSAEIFYKNICIKPGAEDGFWSPQEARSVLPNSLKTEIIVTGNLREWRHFFKLRTAKNAHPQMQEVANMALDMLKSQISVVFDDILT